ncbi:hypothetical protein [Pseudonocardia acaciae]|uniref:Rv2732c family membrane protein n=1 Tax=Pseudonocardia acaciae TaxID=551276 RepID=UPI0005660705|nr:hypothetical protein [Pseudonocardia acaciae]
MEPANGSLDRLDKELSGFRSWPRVEPGVSAMVVAVGVLVLLGGYALPWAGSTSGWNVLVGSGQLGVLPRLFVITSVLFGVLGSTLGLMTRLWAVGWACALGGGFSVVNGLWAVWSRQTAPGAPGPGVGLVLAVLAMALLTLMWVRIAWTRPGGREHG